MEAVIRPTELNPPEQTYTCFAARTRVKPVFPSNSLTIEGLLYKHNGLRYLLIKIFTQNSKTGIRLSGF